MTIADDERNAAKQAYAQAEDCAQRAKTGDLRERHHWLVLENRWLTLARSIEYARRLEGLEVEALSAK